MVDFYPEWEQSFERKIGDENIGRQMIKKLTDALQSEDIDLQEIWSLVDEESFYRFWTVEGLLSFWGRVFGQPQQLLHLPGSDFREASLHPVGR